MVKLRSLSGLSLSMVVAACAVGPDYRRPEVSVPERFVREEAVPSAVSSSADDTFWQSFEDPQLNALIDRGLAANRDLAAAVARYDSANALLREARFDRYPTVVARAEAGRRQVSKDETYGFARNFDTYRIGAIASWELDLFGRVRRSVEAMRAQTVASAADVAAVQVAIAGRLAGTYVEMRGLQERLRVAIANADNQEETLKLVAARVAAGRGSNLDVARAQAQFELTKSRIPALEARIAVHQHRLAVLTGQIPEALIAELGEYRPIPAMPAPIDPGTPASLLQRRPDIAAADARLHAATARVGVATADLFPRLSLFGGLGTQANHTADLFAGTSLTGLIALGVDWSFLDIGRVRARLAASQADSAGLLAQYQQAVLLALEDVENALVSDARTREEHAWLEQAARESAEAARIAQVRYLAGAIDFYEWLDTERVRLAAEDAAAESRTRSFVAVVALYEALAGGWPQRVKGVPTAQSPSGPELVRVDTPTHM